MHIIISGMVNAAGGQIPFRREVDPVKLGSGLDEVKIGRFLFYSTEVEIKKDVLCIRVRFGQPLRKALNGFPLIEGADDVVEVEIDEFGGKTISLEAFSCMVVPSREDFGVLAKYLALLGYSE